ncbi:DUF7946 domain-containing protein [Hoeflea alexandrii]
MDTQIDIAFRGSLAESGYVDAYDLARALAGFQRSLALTTHAVINGEIVVQAPALKNADIVFSPFERGSLLATASVIIGGIWMLNNAKKDTPIGHLIFSAYDYVIKSATGAELDYDKPIRRILEEGKSNSPGSSEKLTPELLDGVIERTESSIIDMHRPLIKSETSSSIAIRQSNFPTKEIDLNRETFEYLDQSIERPSIEDFHGSISSYNSASFTGRVYVPDLGRTVPLLLSDLCRSPRVVDKITMNLRANALRLNDNIISFRARVIESQNGRAKRLIVIDLD